jgi:hypothetical protein
MHSHLPHPSVLTGGFFIEPYMTQKLSAARGADMRIIYHFPPGSDLSGCSGQFIVYDALGGNPVLIAGEIANGHGSQVSVAATTIVLSIKQADIDALAENPDPSSPRIFYFDLRLVTGDGQITKVHGGAFVVLTLGSKTYLNNGAVNATIGGDPIFVQFAGIADIGGSGGGGGAVDPFAQSNIDTLGGNDDAFTFALINAKTLGQPVTANNGTVTITTHKDLTGCHVHMPFKAVTFGTNLGDALEVTDYPVGEEGNTTLKGVRGPAVDMGGSPSSGIHYEKVIRLVGGYAGDGLNQSLPFTAVRVEGDQSSRSSYDIALQNHRGDGLEINSDTEKKVITYRFDHLYEGNALAFRALNLASPDEVNAEQWQQYRLPVGAMVGRRRELWFGTRLSGRYGRRRRYRHGDACRHHSTRRLDVDGVSYGGPVLLCRDGRQ